MVYERDLLKNRLIVRYSCFATSYVLQMLKTLVKYGYQFVFTNALSICLTKKKKWVAKPAFFSSERNLALLKIQIKLIS